MGMRHSGKPQSRSISTPFAHGLDGRFSSTRKVPTVAHAVARQNLPAMDFARHHGVQASIVFRMYHELRGQHVSVVALAQCADVVQALRSCEF